MTSLSVFAGGNLNPISQVVSGSKFYFAGKEDWIACALQADVDLESNTIIMTAVQSDRNRDRLLCPDSGQFFAFQCDQKGFCNQFDGDSLCEAGGYSDLKILPGGKHLTVSSAKCYSIRLSR
jgi:hypothetical protein